ncbi:hypothetical protein CRG98_039617 [Punica granatum]|nr:hypothetical protein CRG98_039617 [Punica granatum]
MVEASTLLDMRRHAVVTGANKGIGLEICRQLASKGVTVVLTSRDEKRGLEAVRKLKQEGSAPLPGEVVFQLDILVNDAGISRIVSYFHALQEAVERIGGWNIPGKSITDALEDVENLTRDRIDELLKDFLEDFQQGQLEAEGWPENLSAYKLSKAALHEAPSKRVPVSFLVNSICPALSRWI